VDRADEFLGPSVRFHPDPAQVDPRRHHLRAALLLDLKYRGCTPWAEVRKSPAASTDTFRLPTTVVVD